MTNICYGTDEIAYRPQIETMIFNRLLSAFGLQKTDVDNSSGYVRMMLGLKGQQLQTSRVKRFYSDTFPEVGLYESPACERMILVGATEAMMSENHMTTTFLSKSMDMQLRNFLDAEASIVISEPVLL